jgi:glycosyltransferase involved in cell wall biosynthesis
MSAHAPKVYMLGLRGFPHVQGGIESHAENLCPLLAQMGCEMHVIARTQYQTHPQASWQGVHFHPLWAPRHKGLEALLHSFLGVLYAAVKRPDVLHVQAIGPALVAPLARLLGLRVVVTHHGPDYDRQKWGRFARGVLRLGERLGMRSAHGRIAISNLIAELIREKYARDSARIPNGVTLPDLPASAAALQSFGLEDGKYVLLVSRIVPEKRHLDLIAAFEQARIPGWKLVLVGSADHPDEHTRKVLEAARSPEIVCTGFQSGLSLAELYTHAGLFVLPSSHEGLPIALLEALSYGLRVLASDIPANLELALPSNNYFELGNVSALAKQMRASAEQPPTPKERMQVRQWVSERYSWKRAAQQTLDIYHAAMRDDRSGN